MSTLAAATLAVLAAVGWTLYVVERLTRRRAEAERDAAHSVLRLAKAQAHTAGLSDAAAVERLRRGKP